MAHVGDSHNFGRRVSVRGERVIKPRTIAWEALLLGKASPLRRFLRESSTSELGCDAFEFLPELEVTQREGEVGGEVERVALEALGSLSVEERRSLAGIVGRSLALFSFLG